MPKRLPFFPVLGVRGEITKVPASKNIYNDIQNLVGSPFDHVTLLPHGSDIGPYLGAFIRDNGLFDGSEPNLSMVQAGFPICGPVMLTGGTDGAGNSLPPFHCDLVLVLLGAAELLADTFQLIERNRENPFTVEALTPEAMKRLFGGDDDAV